MQVDKNLKKSLILLLLVSFGITMSEAGVRMPGFQELSPSLRAPPRRVSLTNEE